MCHLNCRYNLLLYIFAAVHIVLSSCELPPQTSLPAVFDAIVLQLALTLTPEL